MTWLPLPDLPLAWRLYALATLAAAFIVIVINVLFVLPQLARETWEWMHDALKKPDVDRAELDRARMKLIVSISDRKGAHL